MALSDERLYSIRLMVEALNDGGIYLVPRYVPPPSQIVGEITRKERKLAGVVPELLAEIERLRAELAELKERRCETCQWRIKPWWSVVKEAQYCDVHCDGEGRERWVEMTDSCSWWSKRESDSIAREWDTPEEDAAWADLGESEDE